MKNYLYFINSLPVNVSHCHHPHLNLIIHNLTLSHTGTPKLRSFLKPSEKSMDDFRSKSYGHGRMELESYYGNGSNGAGGPNASAVNGMQDLRCYSASYACPPKTQNNENNNISKFKKGKSANGLVSKSWSFSDPELQRKKRVASYKVYTVEGKLKGSLRKSFRWLKETCDRVVYGR